MRRQRIIYTKNATDSDGVNAEYLLIFYHNISKGKVFTTENDFLFANTEHRYSLFGYIDDSYKFDGKKFGFLLEYPDDNTYGFWIQNVNPWEAEHDFDVGYLSKGKNFKGNIAFTGLAKYNESETFIAGCKIGRLWYYSIGSRVAWNIYGSIPGSYGGENPPLYEVFLWIRIPSLSFLKSKTFGFQTCKIRKSRSFNQFLYFMLFIS